MLCTLWWPSHSLASTSLWKPRTCSCCPLRPCVATIPHTNPTFMGSGSNVTFGLPLLHGVASESKTALFSGAPSLWPKPNQNAKRHDPVALQRLHQPQLCLSPTRHFNRRHYRHNCPINRQHIGAATAATGQSGQIYSISATPHTPSRLRTNRTNCCRYCRRNGKDPPDKSVVDVCNHV